MSVFHYQNGELYAENCPVSELIERYGSPCYIYSKTALEQHWQAFDRAFGQHPHQICYAVKANSNLAVLNVLARLGSGFDIVSVGELERVLKAGGEPGKIVFSGVGKRDDELQRALNVGIHCFNIEVAEELDRLNRLAGAMGKTAPISIRVNPDVDAKTHPYISTGLKENKFGLSTTDALAQYQRAAALPHLDIIGIDCHIGSQLTDTRPFLDALNKILELVASLRQQGITLKHLDLGGGLGIRYRDEQPPTPEDYVTTLLSHLGDQLYPILLEPGRAIAGNAGILVTRVDYLKASEDKHFAIVDAAMNDLMRPSLYQAWQDIIAVKPRLDGGQAQAFDIVGPVCETGDFLGKSRDLRLAVGDLLAVCSAGAYGFSMSSNYNSRPRAAEVMVEGEQSYLIRERESLSQLWVGEQLFPA